MPIVQRSDDVGLIFTNPAIQILQSRSGWWFADGAIPAANVLEHVESPTQGQVYAGATISAGGAFTLVAKSTGFTPSGTSRYIFDSQTGRFILGISDITHYGVYNNVGWQNQANIFPDTNVHIWFVTTTGSGTTGQAYLDNSAIGAAFALTPGIQVSGTTRWRASYDNTGAPWGNAVTKAALYNIALDATQRTAIYNSMLNN